jgi:hypothetical protein
MIAKAAHETLPPRLPLSDSGSCAEQSLRQLAMSKIAYAEISWDEILLAQLRSQRARSKDAAHDVCRACLNSGYCLQAGV